MNSNIGATKAYAALTNINNQLSKSQLRLATQKRINSVSDDTSGFAVGKALDQKIQMMSAAQKNVGSARDMLSTVETQLISVKDIVTSIRAKIADSSNAASDNSKIAGDIKALTSELANIFSTTKFNDTKLLVSSSSMTSGTTFSFQTGADATDKLNINYMTNSTGSLSGVGSTQGSEFTLTGVGVAVTNAMTQLANVGTTALAIGSLSAFLNTFESTVDTSLANVGNFMQRLDIKDNFLTSAISNSQSSYSRLFDADMALEQLNATKFQIQQQVATSMLAQANQAPQGVLSLFR
jgi:flagellin